MLAFKPALDVVSARQRDVEARLERKAQAPGRGAGVGSQETHVVRLAHWFDFFAWSD